MAHRRKKTREHSEAKNSAAENSAATSRTQKTDAETRAPNTGRTRRIAEKAVRALDLPADLFSGMLHIEMSGNREAVVDGCRGILVYDENIIRLNAGRCKLQFCGRGLCIRNLTRESVIISGFITSVEFIE